MHNHSKMQNIWKIRNIFHDILFIMENVQHSKNILFIMENVQHSRKCKINSITLTIFVWKMCNILENVECSGKCETNF